MAGVFDGVRVLENRYLTEIQRADGESVTLVRAPVCFDEVTPELRAAPLAGADTEDVLRQVGLTQVEIDRLRRRGVIP